MWVIVWVLLIIALLTGFIAWFFGRRTNEIGIFPNNHDTWVPPISYGNTGLPELRDDIPATSSLRDTCLDGLRNGPTVTPPALRGQGLEPWDGRCPDCGHSSFDEDLSSPSVISTCKRCGTRINGVQQVDGSWMAQRI